MPKSITNTILVSLQDFMHLTCSPFQWCLLSTPRVRDRHIAADLLSIELAGLHFHHRSLAWLTFFSEDLGFKAGEIQRLSCLIADSPLWKIGHFSKLYCLFHNLLFFQNNPNDSKQTEPVATKITSSQQLSVSIRYRPPSRARCWILAKWHHFKSMRLDIEIYTRIYIHHTYTVTQHIMYCSKKFHENEWKRSFKNVKSTEFNQTLENLGLHYLALRCLFVTPSSHCAVQVLLAKRKRKFAETKMPL